MRNNDIYVPNEPELKGPNWVVIIILFCCGIWPIAGWLLVKGLWNENKNHQMRKFRKIARVIGDDGCVSIHRLARQAGMSESDLLATLEKMLQRGYLGREAYIDHAQMELVLTRSAQRDYAGRVDARAIDATIEEIAREIGGQMAHAARRAGEEIGRAAQQFGEGFSGGRKPAPAPQRKTAAPEPEAPAAAPQPKPAPAPEAPTKEDQYEKILSDIQALNDRIADRDVSEKIDRIGAVTSSIFSYLRIHPENEDEVRKFMSYYLPTTLKLLESYALMEKQSYQGENISASRRKIEDILNTLVTAFEQQQDRLFRTEAMDLGADIDVLSTMLRKDGLVGASNPFATATGGAAAAAAAPEGKGVSLKKD